MNITLLLHPDYKAEPWHQFLLYTAITLIAMFLNTFLTPEPYIQGPRSMIYCIAIGTCTGFVFLSCVLFAITSVEDVIAGPRGPLLEVLMQATGNRAGGTCLMMFPLICAIFAVISIMCTSSRMTWAFARDRGIPCSRTSAKVHPRLQLPLNALLWTTGWVIVFGFIYLGSSAAFNAITSASVVALGVTYAIPPTINCLRLRKAPPENRHFRLPGVLGWRLNRVSAPGRTFASHLLTR